MTAAEWIARARAVTDAATPGPWVRGWPWENGWVAFVTRDGAETLTVTSAAAHPDVEHFDEARCEADATFIAASRTMLPAAVAALRAVLALHECVTRWGNEDYSISQDAYDDAEPEDRTSLTAFEVCAECFRIEQTSDQHDGAECEHAVLDGLWPCPTARVLDGLS